MGATISSVTIAPLSIETYNESFHNPDLAKSIHERIQQKCIFVVFPPDTKIDNVERFGSTVVLKLHNNKKRIDANIPARPGIYALENL